MLCVDLVSLPTVTSLGKYLKESGFYNSVIAGAYQSSHLNLAVVRNCLVMLRIY